MTSSTLSTSSASSASESSATATAEKSADAAEPEASEDLATAEETPAGTPVEAEPVAPPAPDPVPETVTDSIWTEPGVGYQCFATDAWVADPAHCTAANLGGDPSYDTQWGPSAAIPAEAPNDQWRHEEGPAPSHENCAAAICGYGHNSQGERNPSSGEIQTLHGCQDGYITDPELCEAVAWVEHHQY